MPTQFQPDETMLSSRGADQERWTARAQEATLKQFGRGVFVRAVVEVSNYCRENCTYCGMRRDNRSLSRFRAEAEQLAELLIEHRPASVTDVNIQAGEDPVAVRKVVLPLLKHLRRETDLGLSVCVGTLRKEIYDELKDAGASIYIMKFEIGDTSEYEKFEAPGNQKERLEHIRLLADLGWQVSSGFIAGLPGQTVDSMLTSLKVAAGLPLSGCSVSPFIPGDETALFDAPMAGIDPVINCIAAMRLMRPDWVIPSVSALNLADPGSGYRRGLRAGGNLATINMTPEGVRGNYLLYKRDRFIMSEERILNAIEAEDRIPSTTGLAEHFRTRKERSMASESAAAV